jgi:hypothetical protein
MWIGSACGVAAAALSLLAGGCASSERSASTDPEPVNSGLSTLTTGENGEAVNPDLDRLLADSERLFDDLWSLQRPAESADRPARTPTAPASPAPPTAESPADEPSGGTAGAESAPPPAPEERIRALGVELAEAIRGSGGSGYPLAIRLAVLRSALDAPVVGLDPLVDSLPPDERDAARALISLLAVADTDPDELAGAMALHAERLAEARPLRIVTAALCSRVEGFGRFVPLPSSTFVAGSPIRMIVYTEVEHFTRSPAGGAPNGSLGEPDAGGEWEVRLSQELQLYHEADGLLAWRQPEEVTVYRARSRPRDFFVVNSIELPRTLTVGAYRLKIVMRDQADRSVDERIIPIRVVADARLVP